MVGERVVNTGGEWVVPHGWSMVGGGSPMFNDRLVHVWLVSFNGLTLLDVGPMVGPMVG